MISKNNKKQNKKSEHKEHITAIQKFIAEFLAKLPHTKEDEERIFKIADFYSRKRKATSGRPQIMAGAIIWLYAHINFLKESEGKVWAQESVAKICGTSAVTIGQKAGALMDDLKIDVFDQRFARREIASKNPMMKMRVDPRSGLLFMEDDNLALGDGLPLIRDQHDYYYEAMDAMSAGYPNDAIRLLRKAIEIDEYSVEAYVGLASVYRAKGNQAKWREYAEKAYQETLKKFPRWPKELRWGVLENREFLRAIHAKACVLWESGDLAGAEIMFRLLLKLNPNDNQGIRYLLAGMFAGITGDDIDAMFDEGNKKQNWNKLENLVDEQNTRYHFWQEPKDG